MKETTLNPSSCDHGRWDGLGTAPLPLPIQPGSSCEAGSPTLCKEEIPEISELPIGEQTTRRWRAMSGSWGTREGHGYPHPIPAQLCPQLLALLNLRSVSTNLCPLDPAPWSPTHLMSLLCVGEGVAQVTYPMRGAALKAGTLIYSLIPPCLVLSPAKLSYTQGSY